MLEKAGKGSRCVLLFWKIKEGEICGCNKGGAGMSGRDKVAAWGAVSLLPGQRILSCTVAVSLISEVANEFALQQSWLLESKGSSEESYGAVLGSMILVCLYDMIIFLCVNRCLTAKDVAKSEFRNWTPF